jgi:hypothetical protein
MPCEFKYLCPRCGHGVNARYLYVRHLKRKNICKARKANVLLDDEYEKFVNNSRKSKKDIENRFKCDFCGKNMSTNQSLHRHGDICKVKINLPIKSTQKEKNVKSDGKELLLNIVSELNKQLQMEKEHNKAEMKEMQVMLYEQIKKQNEYIEVLTKKAGISNVNKGIIINGDVKLVAYGYKNNEDLSDKDILSCMLKNNLCIPALIEMTHCSDKYPHNNNIYISNFRTGYIMVYDGKQWNLTKEEDVLDDMIDCKHYFLEKKMGEWIEENKYSIAIQRFNKYINAIEDDEKLNEIKHDVRLRLYNGRNIIVSHDKQLEM